MDWFEFVASTAKMQLLISSLTKDFKLLLLAAYLDSDFPTDMNHDVTDSEVLAIRHEDMGREMASAYRYLFSAGDSKCFGHAARICRGGGLGYSE